MDSTQKKWTSSSSASAQKGSRRGPSFSAVEDVLIARSFVRTCQDHEKGELFKNKMYKHYLQLVEQEEEKSKHQKDETVFVFKRRNATSIYNRFTRTVSPRVLSFINVVKATLNEGKQTEAGHFIVCLNAYKDLYQQSFEPFCEVYNYLKNNRVFLAYHKQHYESSEASVSASQDDSEAESSVAQNDSKTEFSATRKNVNIGPSVTSNDPKIAPSNSGNDREAALSIAERPGDVDHSSSLDVCQPDTAESSESAMESRSTTDLRTDNLTPCPNETDNDVEESVADNDVQVAAEESVAESAAQDDASEIPGIPPTDDRNAILIARQRAFADGNWYGHAPPQPPHGHFGYNHWNHWNRPPLPPHPAYYQGPNWYHWTAQRHQQQQQAYMEQHGNYWNSNQAYPEGDTTNVANEQQQEHETTIRPVEPNMDGDRSHSPSRCNTLKTPPQTQLQGDAQQGDANEMESTVDKREDSPPSRNLKAPPQPPPGDAQLDAPQVLESTVDGNNVQAPPRDTQFIQSTDVESALTKAVSTFLSTMGSALVDFLKEQREVSFLATLPTLACNEWKQEQRQIRLNEARLKREQSEIELLEAQIKRRRLEQTLNAIDDGLPAAVGKISSSDGAETTDSLSDAAASELSMNS